MRLTKGQLIQVLDNIDDDPQLLAKIILNAMKRLPDAYSWQLAQQLYMDYYWDGPVITVTNNITHISRKFSTSSDIATYLHGLGYKCSVSSITDAVKRGSKTYCNHTFELTKAPEESSPNRDTFYDNKKEITYL